MGTEPPPQKGAEFPNFGPMSIVTKRLDGLRWHLAWRWAFIGLGLIVLHGDPDPFLKKGAEPPQFSAHCYCAQTAGGIKMLLSMEVGLSPRDFVLDGDPAPLLKKGRSLQFLADVYGGQTAA